jgi:isoleucyl-tRNA synthetase
MKASLPKREPEMLARWQEMDLYALLRDDARGRETFILHDGPPYANGDIHMGHVMNKVLKDIIVRSQQMTGKDAPYIPGWDCHGLPIEWKIEEKYRKAGKNKDEVPAIEFRQECRSFAGNWIDIQREQFKRLGITGDWDNPYTTMAYDAEARIVAELMKFAMDGSLYRGSKPVMWSVVEKTALAEAEVEYHDKTSTIIDVAFPVAASDLPELAEASVVIWTTTPWTIPGNRAVAYGDDIDYVLVEVGEVSGEAAAQVGQKLLMAEALVGEFSARAGIAASDIVARFKGNQLASTICAHPWRGKGYDFDVPLIPGDHVTVETGTGFVHTAPGHGVEDYEAGLKVGLEVPFTVGDGGLFYDHVPLVAGQHVFKADAVVCELLTDAGALLSSGKLTHSYPHSWRSRAPLIFRNTPQWFISMSTCGLRDKGLAAVDTVRWVPERSKNRIRTMVETRPDWVISRQRAWGVPITVFAHKESGEVLRDEAVNQRIFAAVQTGGADAWYSTDPAELLGSDYKAEDYEQATDILDVWFDSGSTHAFVLEDREDLSSPADLYLEGSDQHRGWFQSSLLESCGTRGRAPYKAVLTHGFAQDGSGRKMSKSLGNTVEPQKIIDQSGADILRLWVASTDYFEDVRIGKEILGGQVDAYRKMRNTLRFLLGNLADFDEAEVLDYDQLPELERWVLHRLHKLDGLIRAKVADFDYNPIYQALYNFCIVDLSALYFDIRKDCLYCDPKMSVRRRAARTVLDRVFHHLTAWLAPILVFTAEEVWQARFGETRGSVHLQQFPEAPDDWRDDALAEKWQKVRALRRVVTGALEVDRREKRIGSSLQASPTVYVADQAYIGALEGLDLAEVFITSGAIIAEQEPGKDAFTLNDVPGVGVVSALAEGAKCGRCWMVLPEVGKQSGHDDLCARCADAVEACGGVPAGDEA